MFEVNEPVNPVHAAPLAHHLSPLNEVVIQTALNISPSFTGIVRTRRAYFLYWSVSHRFQASDDLIRQDGEETQD